MAKFYNKTNLQVARHAILLLGDPGAGKTRLAKTAPAPYFIDMERGAAGIGVDRVEPDDWADLLKIIGELKVAKRLPGYGLSYHDTDIKTIVLDTVDSVQEACRRANETMIGDAKKKQQFYGKLLDEMLHKVIWPLMSLPCDVILVCHSAEKNLDAVETSVVASGKASILPETTLALEGSLRKRLLSYFDNIFHLINLQDGKKIVLTVPTVYEGRYLIAKDRRFVFGGKEISLGFTKEGEVQSDAFTKIFADMHKGDEKDALINRLKKVAAEYAVEKKVMASKTDAVGGKVLAGLMNMLQLDNLTEANYASVLFEFKKLIDEKAPKESSEEPVKYEDKKIQA